MNSSGRLLPLTLGARGSGLGLLSTLSSSAHPRLRPTLRFYRSCSASATSGSSANRKANRKPQSLQNPQAILQELTTREEGQRWCESEDALSSIFGGFTHLPACALKDVEGLVSIFQTFTKELLPQDADRSRADPPTNLFHTPWCDLSVQHRRGLDKVASFLSSDRVEWFPDFGCSVLAFGAWSAEMYGEEDQRPSIGTYDIWLVGLDEWKAKFHRSVGGLVQPVSECQGHTPLFCGRVDVADYSAFLANLHTRVDYRPNKQIGSGGDEDKVHKVHWTPGYVLACVYDALEDVARSDVENGTQRRPKEPSPERQKPIGGFTDVGRHTGCLPRDTAWPIVRETIQVFLDHSGIVGVREPHLFDLLQVHLQLWLLTRQTALVNAPTATPEVLSACMLMALSTAKMAAKLSDEGQDVSSIEGGLRLLRRHLDEKQALRAEAMAFKFQVPEGSFDADTVCLPMGTLPEKPAPNAAEGGRKEVGLRAAENLGSLVLLPPGSSNAEILAWMELPQWGQDGGDATMGQLVLRSLEQEMFSRAVGGFDRFANSLALEKMVDKYRGSMRTFIDSTAHEACMEVELRSREILVVWVAACLMHKSSCMHHPMTREYGIGLDWQALEHLVLSNRMAVDAALSVSAYIMANTKEGRALFTVVDNGAATFEFAVNFSAKDKKLSSILDREKAVAAKRVEAHWVEVQRKQRLGADLREQLRGAEAKLSEIRQWLKAEKAGGRQGDPCRDTNKIAVQQAAVDSIKENLSVADMPPPAVIQPLPQADDNARRWLFFLHMPLSFSLLSRATFLAQQMLLPHPRSTVFEETKVQACKTHIASHYNEHQSSRYHKQQIQYGADGMVELHSMQEVPTDNQINPSHVFNMTEAHFGVWYPDSFRWRGSGCGDEMRWKGSGCAHDQVEDLPSPFNPFGLVPRKKAVASFTEALKDADAPLQWCMSTCGTVALTEPTRSNLAVARQDQKPLWLSKPGFLALGALRSYSSGQYRRLCAALCERTLPLAQPLVRSVVLQTLYHVGTFYKNNAGKVDLQWRSDWADSNGILDTLHFELDRLAAELEQTPREHDSVLLLGNIAAYLSDWHEPCIDTARCFGTMTQDAAEQMDSLIHEANLSGKQKAKQGLQARQSQLRMTSLLCYAAGPRTDGDVVAMIQLMVLINHGRIFLEDQSEEDRRLASQLHIRCLNVMALAVANLAARANGIVSAHAGVACRSHAPESPESVTCLTSAVSLVLGHTPTDLAWTQLCMTNSGPSSQTASFEAEGSDSHKYSINLLDGTVLLDGSPASRLAKDIVSHPMYRRVFGDLNFEVSVTRTGVSQTLRAIKGHFYNFNMAGSTLVITELDEDGRKLELLDVGDDLLCAPWGKELPVRLRQLHSHWLCREESIIVVRPISFQSHATHFIIECSPGSRARTSGINGSTPSSSGSAGSAGSTESARLQYNCLRVPVHLREPVEVRWNKVLSDHRLELTDQLVLPTAASVGLNMIAKLEDSEFIHCYEPASFSSANGTEQGVGLSPVTYTLLWELPRYGLEFEQHDGLFKSRDYAGFKLAKQQQLVWSRSEASVEYTLPNFQQYLVLERMPQEGMPVQAQTADTMVIIPDGVVTKGQATADTEVQPHAQQKVAVHVEVSAAVDASLKVHRYSIHPRFGHLVASSILSRLQLAACYAATGTLLPEPRSKMTGAQLAMQLVSWCWTNRPLTAEEHTQLLSVVSLGMHHAPGLFPLCRELELSSFHLSHLHLHVDANRSSLLPSQEPTASSLYMQEKKAGNYGGWCSNPRLLLSSVEEERSMGVIGTTGRPTFALQNGSCRQIDVPACGVSDEVILFVEATLLGMVEEKYEEGAKPAYPLVTISSGADQQGAGQDGGPGALVLPDEMHEELAHSWDKHHSSPSFSLRDPIQAVGLYIRHIEDDVCEKRMSVERYLLHSLNEVPRNPAEARNITDAYQSSFRMLRMADGAAAVGLMDLVRAALHHPDHLLTFNPFLSGRSCQQLHKAVLLWLQLCVLEDRLARLDMLCESKAEQQLVQELQVRRQWDVAEHPEWLVFEVEGRLQIRPEQYVIAERLMREPGAFVQLNMGGGKTRVILPMLVLHLTKKKDKLIRLNFLSTLLNEAGSHLHNNICASVLGCKVFTMPFVRDVKLDARALQAMRASLLYCQKAGGVLIVAPEHRLSLKLKWHELKQGRQVDKQLCSSLQALMELPCLDILDESDELLHHRSQLIYAVGNITPLPALETRTSAIHALLDVITRQVDDHSVDTLADNNLAVWTSESSRPPGSFCQLRLVSGSTLESAAPEWPRCIAAALVEDPPLWLQWISDKSQEEKGAIVACILDEEVSASHALSGIELREHERQQLLILRGMLACNKLRHCLQKRHLVDYGINRSPTARKRLAVPFRAARTPSVRSEFADPDVALTLTVLSYYHDGLSEVEFHAALEKLLQMGINAQHCTYKQWFDLSRDKMPAEDKAKFSKSDLLDASNPRQVELLYTYYSHNMACVAFWLDSLVLPEETQQFPQRLAHHSWHLADNPEGQIMGFSGTNDNHRLLPLQVHQALMEEGSLRATNGKMLDLIMANNRFVTLPVDDHQRPAWQLLLDTAVREGHNALIDCGAMLADTSNKNAAEYLLTSLDAPRYKGVVYFDPALQLWMAMEKRGRCLPLHCSPVHERDAFVIFDDARCRGTDMKLHSNAVGLLTIGPGMCKDKMMQAAGRLRQLDKGQSLCFVSAADVSSKIRELNGIHEGPDISSLQLLRWVMHNTIQSTMSGVHEWASQGLHFARTKNRPEKLAQDELMELEQMYGDARGKEDVSSLVKDMARPLLGDQGSRTELQEMVQLIVTQSNRYGSGHEVVSGHGMNEECERELETEEEVEEEQEVEVPPVEPLPEAEWKYECVLSAQSVSEIDPASRVFPMLQMIRVLNEPKIAAIKWSSHIFCTANYLLAIKGWPSVIYLRPVESLLHFPSGEVLLLSEREADAVQEALGQAIQPARQGKLAAGELKHPQLLMLCYAQLAAYKGLPLRLALGLDASHSQRLLSDDVLVSLGLFNGDAMFAPGQRAKLREMMQNKEESASELVGMRGKRQLLPQSDVEDACKGLRRVP